MAGTSISAPAVAAAGAGALVLYAGMKGISVTGGLRALLSGQPIPTAVAYPLTSGTSDGTTTTAVAGPTGSALADRGMSYVGSGSVYGWAGGGPRVMDCSGFCNQCAGRDLGLPIPGHPDGRYSGHGPATPQWAIWPGCHTIPRSQVQAGDLCIWPLFHMGIAISNTQMVNCPGPNGTPNPVVGKIDGGGTGVLVCRRYGRG